MTQSPILFLVFNRPDTTKRVFEAIRAAKPLKLYVAADGPRSERVGEAEVCQQVREISTAVDWQCEVITLFRDSNLGCRKAVSEAITWFFNLEEEGIILEDDCLPHPDFFLFCDQLLERYRHIDKVMHISGAMFMPNGKHNYARSDYYFSHLPHIWGWASWRRAWAHYDVELKTMQKYQHEGQTFPFRSRLERQSFWPLFLNILEGQDTWDYQWLYTVLEQQGLCIHPVVNLVSNIGFGKEGTHAVVTDHPLANLPVYPLKWPLQHPKAAQLDVAADDLVIKKLFYKSSVDKIKYKLKNQLKHLLTSK